MNVSEAYMPMVKTVYCGVISYYYAVFILLLGVHIVTEYSYYYAVFILLLWGVHIITGCSYYYCVFIFLLAVHIIMECS